MTKVLIIGGTGNIGTGVTHHLLQKGNHDITHVNRGNTPVQGVKSIIADRSKPAEFGNALSSAGNFDCVIDMICYKPDEAKQAVEIFKGKTGQYIMASTVDVYDRRFTTFPIKEDQAIGGIHPDFDYAVNKVICEEIFESAINPEFAVTIIRPAQTYSEGLLLVHLFGWDSFFIDRIRKGKKIIAHGDGSSLWVAAHRDDVSLAFANAVGNTKAYCKKYNVTGLEVMTWLDYYRILAEGSNFPAPQFVFIPTSYLMKLNADKTFICRENFSRNNLFDNSAAIADLGYKYTISWKEGSARSVKWLIENNKLEDYTQQPYYDEIINRWEKTAGSI